MKLRKYLPTSIVASLLFVTTLALMSFNTAYGLSGSSFQAGRIIDDPVFFDNGGLSLRDIQEFLNAKVPDCDTSGSMPYAGTTAAAYGTSRGYPPPYTCLKSYRQDTNSKPADTLCKGYPQLNQSAAEIIYGVAQSCGINPTVLLVLLQKEQGLVTDSWPWPSQYTKATGYACPDTAPCDAQYSGFFNQVYSAARQLINYTKNQGSFNYQASRNNMIRYNPTSSCGSANIYIQNLATSALYNYTPYQPNQAALDNLYGQGDSCSAYGNRNFWRLYNDWFGSTSTPAFRWEPVSQQIYTDSSKSTPLGNNNIVPGQRFFASITVRNVGTRTWDRGAINLGTSQPQSRSSTFKDWTWPSTRNDRTGSFIESTVTPGQTATFDFWMQTPNTPGQYAEYFNLVAENITWMNDMGLNLKLGVDWTHYNWEETSKDIYVDSSKQVKAAFNDLQPSRRYLVTLKAKNTGNVTWQKNDTNLATFLPANRPSLFKDWTWPSTNNNRAGTFSEASVAPGQTATFNFWIMTPNVSGVRYTESFNLITASRWMVEIGQQFVFTVNRPHYGYDVVSAQTFTDASRSTPLASTALTPDQRFFATVVVKNTGSMTWQKGITQLATTQPINRPSLFKDWTWPSTNNNRAGTFSEASVAPGQTATFNFWMKAPAVADTYAEHFSLLAENIAWMNDMNIMCNLVVN